MSAENRASQVAHHLDPVQVARHIIARDAARPEPDVTQLKLQKILYLVQANFLAATGHRLLDTTIEAFDHGPVIDEVRREFRQYGRKIIAPELESQPQAELPEDARAFVDAVWEQYKDTSAGQLRRLSHAQAPWKDNYVEGQLHTEIPDHEISSFFRDHVDLAVRVFHPDAIVVDEDFIDDLDQDEDDIVARAATAFA